MSDIKFDIELKLKELEEIVAKMNDESTCQMSNEPKKLVISCSVKSLL